MRFALAATAVVVVLASCKKGGPVVPPENAGTSGLPHFDGIYAVQLEGDAGQGVDLLRFVDGGKVLSISSGSANALENAAQLLMANSDKCAKGTFELKDGVLRFTLKSSLGTVDYAGAAHEDKLIIRWRSGINDVSMENTYDFIKVVDDSAPDASAGASEDSDAGAPEMVAADDSLIPDGSSWYCFRGKPGSRCERKAQACESARKRKDPKLAKCAKQTAAYCFTAVQKSALRGSASCSSTEEDCKADLAAFDAERSADVVLSACTKK